MVSVNVCGIAHSHTRVHPCKLHTHAGSFLACGLPPSCLVASLVSCSRRLSRGALSVCMYVSKSV